jgi:hypothetical protein
MPIHDRTRFFLPFYLVMPLAAIGCGRALSVATLDAGSSLDPDATAVMQEPGSGSPGPGTTPPRDAGTEDARDAGASIPDGGCTHGIMCDGRCVDPNSDPISCGACSRHCEGGTVCSDGLCMTSCRTGLTACGGACVDVSLDDANCGQCGTACGDGFRCAAGACNCPGSICHGACTDIKDDPSNCGGCGYGCPSVGTASQTVGDNEFLADMPLAQYCNLGLCALYCSRGTNLCGLSCVVTESDDNNCGRCGVVCPSGSSCKQGACTCSNEAETVCDGLCVNTQTSAADCGACDAPCPDGVACLQGACAIACPDDMIACGNSCVDPMTTKEHCGLCNQVCEGNLVCANGQCACPPGWMQCGGGCVEVESGACP